MTLSPSHQSNSSFTFSGRSILAQPIIMQGAFAIAMHPWRAHALCYLPVRRRVRSILTAPSTIPPSNHSMKWLSKTPTPLRVLAEFVAKPAVPYAKARNYVYLSDKLIAAGRFYAH